MVQFRSLKMSMIVVTDPYQAGEFELDSLGYTKDICIKYASLGWVKAHLSINTNLHKLIMKMSTTGNYNLIDIKIRKHLAGDCTCIEGFHYDCVKELDDPTPLEQHCIWTNTEGTFFEEFRAEPMNYYVYGRHLHKGPVVEKDCVRALIRLTQSDVIKPKQLRTADLIIAANNFEGNNELQM